MNRRSFLGASVVLSLPACHGGVQRPAPPSPMAPLRARYEELMREHGLHEWSRYAGVSTPGSDAAGVADLRRREEDVVTRAAEAAARAPDVEPREKALWKRAATGLALLGDAKSVQLADELEKTVNDFAFDVDGKRVSRGDLRKLARSDDERDRKAQRHAYGALHAKAAPIARALLKQRHDLGRRGAGFHAELLELRGIEASRLLSLLFALRTRTADAFARALADGRDRAKLAVARPWDVDVVTKKLGDSVDDVFSADGARPMATALFAALGVDLERPKIQIDVRDFAFAGQTISVRVPDDVRTVITPTPGPRFYGTLLHELGHAFASTRNTEENAAWRSYEWIPGMTEPGYEEGIAEVFGRSLDEEDTLAAFVPKLPADARASFLRARARTELFTLRQRLVAIEFERLALGDPDGDLDALARKLDREILGLDVPDDTPPVWATSPFLATYPVYVQSYVLAGLLSAQLRASLRATLGGPWLTAKGGALLADVVHDGARTSTDEKLTRATGAPLGIDAYLAGLMQRV